MLIDDYNDEEVDLTSYTFSDEEIDDLRENLEECGMILLGNYSTQHKICGYDSDKEMLQCIANYVMVNRTSRLIYSKDDLKEAVNELIDNRYDMIKKRIPSYVNLSKRER